MEISRTSRAPPHLRPFHRPSQPFQPAHLKEPANLTKSQSPELCPPHWRVGSQRGLIAHFKSWTGKRQPTTPPQDERKRRPVMGRMKDSDDYITARAANPWTGLISPSPATQTPCTAVSPAEALSLGRRTPQQGSPTHVVKRRPVLAKANECRKISGGNWRGTTKEAQGQVRSEAQDDRFVVHMPSAREPQPFAYPGYTAEQIEALEHYRRKARRVSSEGYDQRLFHNTPGAWMTAEEQGEGAHPICPRPQHRPITRRHDEEPTSPEPLRLMVRKREKNFKKSMLHSDQAQAASATLIDQERSSPILGPMPPSSISLPPAPGTTIHSSSIVQSQHTTSQTHPKHAEKNLLAATTTPTELGSIVTCRELHSRPKLRPNKPIDTLSAPSKHADYHEVKVSPNTMHSTKATVAALPGVTFTSDWCQLLLPPVRLAKPNHNTAAANAVPRGPAVVVRNSSGRHLKGRRQCSLGCERDNNGQGECLPRRVSLGGTVIRSGALFEIHSAEITEEEGEGKGYHQENNGQGTKYTEHLLNLTLRFLRYLGSLRPLESEC